MLLSNAAIFLALGQAPSAFGQNNKKKQQIFFVKPSLSDPK